MVIAAHDWLALSRLLDIALSLPACQRQAWVEGLSGADEALKPVLRDLLGREDLRETGDFLVTLPKLMDIGPPPGANMASGQAVGMYRLERLLGAGGMGSVWLADRAGGAQAQGRTQVAARWRRAPRTCRAHEARAGYPRRTRAPEHCTTL